MKTYPSRYLTTPLFSALLVVSPLVHAAVAMGPVVNPANGHRYYLLTPTTWTEAENEARNLGGHLVTINDETEQAWVYSTFSVVGSGSEGKRRSLMIGLNDKAVEGTFEWVSGEASPYRNWKRGEPNNQQGKEDCVMMWGSSGLWNDFTSGTTMSAVVEALPPGPRTVTTPGSTNPFVWLEQKTLKEIASAQRDIANINEQMRIMGNRPGAKNPKTPAGKALVAARERKLSLVQSVQAKKAELESIREKIRNSQ